MPKSTFSLLRALNHAPDAARHYRGDSHVFPSRIVAEYFTSEKLTDRFIRALVERHILQWKEILEAFEFFDQTRKYLGRRSIVDACCGHGLIGTLYAMLVEEVEDVTLADAEIPKSQSRMLEVANDLAPWTLEKITVQKRPIETLGEGSEKGAAVVSSHGCGALTDQAIDLGLSTGGPIAVMPCCCHPRHPDAPDVIFRELGIKDGVDVDRTYRMNAAGYRVLWRYIPEDIAPMNRILIGAVS